MGGGDGGKALSDVWIFDSRTLLWRDLSPTVSLPPSPRGYHAACVVGSGSQLVISGGSNSTETFAGIDVLDLAEGSWSRREERRGEWDGLDRRRSYHALVPLGNLLLLIGGDENEPTAHTHISCFDIRSSPPPRHPLPS